MNPKRKKQVEDFIAQNPDLNADVVRQTLGQNTNTKIPQKAGLLENIGRALLQPAISYGKTVGAATDKDPNAPEKYLGTEGGANFRRNAVGNVIKDTAGVLSYAVPGSMGAKGAALAGGLAGFGSSDLDKGAGDAIKNTAIGAGTGYGLSKLVGFVGNNVNKIANKGKEPTLEDFRKAIASQGQNARISGNTNAIGDQNSVMNALTNGSLDDQFTKQGYKLTGETKKKVADQLRQEMLMSGDLNPNIMKELDKITGSVDNVAGAASGVADDAGKYKQEYDKLTQMRNANMASPEEFIAQEELVQKLKPQSKANQFFKDLRGSELDVPRGKYDFNVVDTKRTLQNNLSGDGLSFDLKGIQAGKKKAGEQLDGYIEQVFKSDPKKRFTGGDLFGDNFDLELDNISMGMGDNARATNEKFFKSFLNRPDLGEYKDIINKEFAIGDVKAMVQGINKGLRDKTITGSRKKVAEAMKTQLMDVLTKEAPEYNQIARKYAVYAAAENPTALRQLRGEQTASTNVINEVTQKGFNKAKRAVGFVGDKLTSGAGIKLPGGQSAQKLAQNLQGLQGYLQKSGLPQTQIAAIMGSIAMNDYMDNNGNGIPDSQEGLESGDSMGAENIAGMSTQDGDIGQKRLAIAQSLMSMTDGKGNPMYDYKSALEQANAALELQGITSESSAKAIKPTENQTKYKSAGEQAQKALEILDSGKASSGKVSSLLNSVGRFAGTQSDSQTDYNSKLASARGIAINALSGANVPPSEYERIAAMIPQESDEPQIAKQKLRSFIDAMNTFASR